MEKYLVTSALPYANGKLHIGHVAGAYLPADIFVRYKRLHNADVLYICGTDEHGAPISIAAEKEGVTPADIVERYHSSIKNSFDGLNIEFDNFSGTSRKAHHELSQTFFTELLENGFISTKTGKQFYDEKEKRFLPDRYIEGVCPHCGKDGARGDQCDACGKLIDAETLVNPISKISGATPILKETFHWCLDLPKFTEKLKTWLETKEYWKENVVNFIMSWLKEGLIERAITRDINWGVPIPIEGVEGKVLYVWFDAPIGYISSTKEWAESIGEPEKWKDYWLDQETRLIHFIGKDNIPFHTIIWPSLLMGQNEKYILPYDVPANEYLTLEGEKISTSKNWAIWVEDFLKDFDGEYLRYAIAANAPENKDADFNWKEFQSRINSELNNVFGNLVNRVFTFTQKRFEGVIAKPGKVSVKAKETLQEAMDLVVAIDEAFNTYQIRKAIKLIMDIARRGNRYCDETQPWKTIKETPEDTKETLYVCGKLIQMISVIFYPVIPTHITKLRVMMGLSEIPKWDEIEETPTITLSDIAPLFSKIEDKQVEEQIAILTEKSKAVQVKEVTPIKANIEFDDFMKADLRVVKVLTAEKIKKTDKLLKVEVDDGIGTRTVVAGISKHYKPEDLIGKNVVMLVNLNPRKLRGVESQGMILACTDGDILTVLHPEKEVSSGSTIS
ncbi:MAG: methionine--tRNA ligase [Candidatus Zophobacter franzmannii]|nr:methionine--tRNA ligase [Candidatus Zophobacter franzmannii]